MSLSWAVRGRTPDIPTIANPLKKIVRQRNFLGFTTKLVRCETMRAPTDRMSGDMRSGT